MSKLEEQLAVPFFAAILEGEPIICATRTATRRKRNEAPLLVPFGGAIKDAIKQSEVARRNALPFMPRPSMALALTPTRLLFWSYGGFLIARPRDFLGAVARADVHKIELSRRRALLTLWFAERTMELEVPDLDSAGRLAAAASPPAD